MSKKKIFVRLLGMWLCATAAIPCVAQQQDSTKIAWKIKTSTIDVKGLLPKETHIASLKMVGENLVVNYDIPAAFLKNNYDETIHEELVETVSKNLSENGFLNIHLNAKTPKGEFVPISYFFTGELPPINIPKSYVELGRLPRENTEKTILSYPNKAQPFGGLYGKTVWVSPGHGWLYNNNVKRYITQRGNTFGLVEDFSNEEAVNYYLLKYLYNAGANVWSVRERDLNTNEIIVDNEQGTPHYTEVGKWAGGTAKGYKEKGYRFTQMKSKEDAQAIFRPDIPETGWYWVSTWYYPSKNRATDVRYKIQHAGGESVVSINQQIHGETWVYLGQFYFEKGNKGAVVVSNESSDVEGVGIADVIRFGGGKGEAVDCDFADKMKTSPKVAPRHELSSRYYTRYMGYPECKNDVTIRPAYAEWELAKGSTEERSNAIYFSWHTNASGGQGTESFVHTFRGNFKSRKLRELVHDQLISDIRQAWKPNWKDRGKKSADLGELRGISTMPAMLIEVAFHDNEEDAKDLTKPAFRQLTARAIYKGIAKYFASQDGRKPIFLPETPTHLHAYNNGDGNITLSWQAPPFGGVLGDAATRYKIYMGTHGKAFGSNTKDATETSFTFTGLEPETTYYFRVVATNGGGDSFPSSVIAVRTPKKGQTKTTMLLVDGFDRLDEYGAIKTDLGASLGVVNRLFIDKMNSYDYVADHARSLGKTGISFDGATNEAIADKKLTLSKYKGINWLLGEESSVDETLSKIEQGLLADYLDKGGNLIISGTELGYHLDKKNAGRDFYRNYLKATYVGDNAGTFQFQGVKDAPTKGIKGSFDRSGMGYYLADYPDYIKPHDGSVPLFEYDNGRIAAVGYKKKYGVVNAGFPFELIADEGVKDKLFEKIIEFLALDKIEEETEKKPNN